MSYQVFARKYRPRTFDDVLGQEHVVRTLRNAIAQNRLAHAYLFVGPRGTGKTSTARIFAKALNCPGGPKVDFDPDDEICVEIEKGINLDVREIDGASNNGVEQVRELREEVKFAPTRSRYKIYYIDEVHMLSTAAFNALLKTLEEPPEHVKFIFATTEAHKVLPTIISRCQRFDLRRIPTNVIASHLLHIASLEKVNLDEKAAFAIAKGAEGGMRDAQSMLDQLVAFCGEKIEEQDVLDIFGFTQGETVANLAQQVLQQDTVGALQQLHAQADGGKDLSRLLSDLIQHLRTLLVHQVDPAGAEQDLSPELAELVRNQAATIEADRLLRVMDGLAEVDSRMRWANNKLLHLEIGLIQAVQTLGEVSLSDVIHALDGGEVPKTAARRAVASPATPVQRAMPAVAVTTPKKASPSPQSSAIDDWSEMKKEARADLAPAQPNSPPAAKAASIEPGPASPVQTPVVTEASSDISEESSRSASPVDISSPDGLKLAWQEFVSRVQVERPLFSHWVEFGALLKVDKNIATIGLPETEDAARENLMRAGARKFVEEILSGVIGKPVLIEIVFDSSLEPPPVTELSLGLLEPDTPSSAVAVAKEPEPKPPVKEEPAKATLEADFYNDPLINAAIEKFKATLVK